MENHTKPGGSLQGTSSVNIALCWTAFGTRARKERTAVSCVHKKECLSCDWTKGWEKPKGEQKPKVWEVNPHRHKPPLCSVQSQQPQLPRQAIAPAAKFHSLDGDRRRLYLCLPRSHGFLGISGSSWYHCAQFCVSRMLNCWYSVVPNMYSGSQSHVLCARSLCDF